MSPGQKKEEGEHEVHSTPLSLVCMRKEESELAKTKVPHVHSDWFKQGLPFFFIITLTSKQIYLDESLGFFKILFQFCFSAVHTCL